jgi:hypothetical protein
MVVLVPPIIDHELNDRKQFGRGLEEIRELVEHDNMRLAVKRRTQRLLPIVEPLCSGRALGLASAWRNRPAPAADQARFLDNTSRGDFVV